MRRVLIASSSPLPERADIFGALRGLIRYADDYEDADADADADDQIRSDQISEMFDREMD